MNCTLILYYKYNEIKKKKIKEQYTLTLYVLYLY